MKNRLGHAVEIRSALGCGMLPRKTDEADIAKAVETAKGADVAIVYVGTNLKIEAEDRDRSDLALPGAQEQLIDAVYAANPKTVVVLMNAGPVSTKWARDNVPAMLEAWYAGEEGGNAIADVLLGDYNPAGGYRIRCMSRPKRFRQMMTTTSPTDIPTCISPVNRFFRSVMA